MHYNVELHTWTPATHYYNRPYLVLKPAVLLQHLLTLDCAFKAVKLELHLWNSVNQPLKHILP